MASSAWLSFSSSILPSPLQQNPMNNPAVFTPTKLSILCAFAAPARRKIAAAPPSTAVPKKRHWKEGEFPGISETALTGTNRKAPLKNVKKKLDRKSSAKAWVNTVTEALAERVSKKQWREALEVSECEIS